MTTIFHSTKEAVPLLEAIKRYGLDEPKKNFIPCPFHEDRTPSMQVRNNFYHCFGCGASGDVISFVQRLFALEKPIDAVKKLRRDFGLGECKASDKAAVRALREEQFYTYAFDIWEKRAFKELNAYVGVTVPSLALRYREKPEAMRRLYDGYSTVEHLLEVLTCGSREEKIEVYKEFRDVVRRCMMRNRYCAAAGADG